MRLTPGLDQLRHEGRRPVVVVGDVDDESSVVRLRRSSLVLGEDDQDVSSDALAVERLLDGHLAGRRVNLELGQ